MTETDPDAFRMPAAELRHEIDKIKGSRFIATLAPIADPADADARLEAIRREFADARHTCFAWRLDPEGRRFRAGDDGEPAGSAGKPILQQVEGREVARTLVAVTRYFGGVKLGVGGLMRAYGAAAAAALERASWKVVLRTERVTVEHPYECSGGVQGLLSAWKLEPLAAVYGADVRFELDLPRSRATDFLDELRECTAGRARAERLPPID